MSASEKRQRLMAPARLAADPIVDAVIELRFDSHDPEAGDILPGALYQQLKSRYGKLESLPLSQMPAQARRQDPSLAIQPTRRLRGDRYGVFIGDQVIGISALAPYGGWADFRERAVEVFDAVNALDLVSRPTRYAIKYVNHIPCEPTDSGLDKLNVSVSVGDYSLAQRSTHVRTEFQKNGYVVILQVATHIYWPPNTPQQRHGVILDIDVIKQEPVPAFFDEVGTNLDKIHTAEKEVFFSLIAAEALDEFQPEYGDQA